MSLAEQLIREKASEVIESRQEPDRYSLLIRNGRLISPFTGESVENSMERTSAIGKREFAAFDQTQKWAATSAEGLAFWVSPPNFSRSEQTKVIVYEITGDNNQRALLNRSLLFDIDYNASLGIANEIAGAFENPVRFSNPEEVRANTIISSSKISQEEWLPIITKVINDQRQWLMIAQGEDILIAEKTTQWIQKGEYNQHLGSNPKSCPPSMYPGTVSEVIVHHSIILEGKFVKNCGKCGKPINKTIFKGYQCECGGIYEGC